MTLKEWLADRYPSLSKEKLSRLLTIVETINSHYGKNLSREERKRIYLPLANELSDMLGLDESIQLGIIMLKADGQPQGVTVH